MTAFTMLLPRGWFRFDLAVGVAAGLEETLSRFVQLAAPVHQPAARRLVETTVRPALAELADGGAISVILALGEDPTQPMIVCRPLQIPTDITPVEWLAGMVAADPTAELVDVPELLAVRSVDQRDGTDAFLGTYADFLGVAPPSATDPAGDLRLMCRQVTYMVGDPDDPAQWLSFSLGVQQLPGDAGRDLADLAVHTFDAMMTTLRWVA